MNEDINSRMYDCDLDVQGSLLEANTLTVSYTFRNRNTRNAYLFNRLYTRRSDRLEINSNLFYLEMDDSKLIICKKIAKVPEGTHIYKPIVPFVTKVPAGVEFHEEFSVALPINGHAISPPYSAQDFAAEMQRPPSLEAWFELGFFLASTDGDRLVRSVPTAEGPALYFEPFSFVHQKLLRDGPLINDVAITIVS